MGKLKTPTPSLAQGRHSHSSPVSSRLRTPSGPPQNPLRTPSEPPQDPLRISSGKTLTQLACVWRQRQSCLRP
eukprot:1183929-Prorocentrum_minimum.AAC.1